MTNKIKVQAYNPREKMTSHNQEWKNKDQFQEEYVETTLAECEERNEECHAVDPS